MKNIIYDKVFVGAGVIHLIEAIYQKKLGKNVLVIEKKDKVGGAWRPIDIFGLKNVENAIHYFLPDKNAPKFMMEILKWPIIESRQKYRCIKLPVFEYCLFKYDGFISTFLSELNSNQGLFQLIKTFFLVTFNYFVKNNKPRSYYIEGGASIIYKYINRMIKHHKLDIIYNTDIEEIYFDTNNKVVKINPEKNETLSKQIVFSHGSRLTNIKTSGKSFNISEKTYRRPALHMLIKDTMPSSVKECILYKDTKVKYIHDVSEMVPNLKLRDKEKIFIFGMHSDIKNSQETIDYSLKLLKNINLISRNAILIEYSWSDTFLPTLHDEDLEKLKNRFGNLVDYLKTEDFARGIGYYCNKWSKQDIFI